MLIVVAGLGTGLASRAAGQCNTAAPPQGPGGKTLPVLPTLVPLGAKVQATGTSLSATWNNVTGACNYTVQWWGQGQSPAASAQTQVPVPAPGTTTAAWSGSVNLSPGAYTMRVSVGLGGGKFGFNDVAFQVAPQLQVVTAIAPVTLVPAGGAAANRRLAPGRTPVAPPAAPTPTAPPPPPAPTGLTITGITPASARVRWNATPGATGHTIERMTTAAGPCAGVGPVPVTGTSWQDDGTHYNCSYTYRLTASFGAGSPTLLDQSYTPPKPVNPFNFTAQQNGAGSVSLTWAAVNGASYYMVSGPGAGSGWMKVTGTSQTLTGVPTGIQAWRLATYYDPGAVADLGSASRATLDVRPVAAAMAASFTVTCAAMLCTFDASGSSSGIQTYVWTWRNARETRMVPLFKNTFLTPGTYDVTLTVTGPGGSASTSRSVSVGSVVASAPPPAAPPAAAPAPVPTAPPPAPAPTAPPPAPPPVTCNDGNPATSDVLVNGTCSYPNLPLGAPCGPPAGGQADGYGKCVLPPAPQPAPPPAATPPPAPPVAFTGPTGSLTLTPVSPPPAPPAATINPRGGIALAGGTVGGRRGMAAPAGPAGVSVTGTPATATVSWQPVAGVASYTIVRQEPNMAPAQVATLPASATTWSDLRVHPSKTYTFVVNAVYPDGTQGSGQASLTTPPAINPSGFTGKETAPGTVQLSWNPVPGITNYVLLGPGIPGGGTSTGLTTSFTATGVPPGNQTWMVASYYNPTGVQGAAVSTPGSQFPTASLNILPPPLTGNYLITVTGIRAVQMSADDILSRDGRGDEVFAAAYVRKYDRKSGQLSMSAPLKTLVYGDVNGSTTRVQGGTQSPMGGIRDGDMIPGTNVERGAVPPGDMVFPWRLYEGPLTDRADALVISPSIWEVDNNDAPYQTWVQQQANLSASVFVTQSVQYQMQQNDFGYLTYGGADTPGFFTVKAPYLAADAVLAGLGLPPIASLLSGSLDRPIGAVPVPNGNGSLALPNMTVVLTREIIEQALSQAPIGLAMVNNQLPIFFPKPGIMAIPFVDGPGGGFIKDRPAIYYMILQVEKCPCQ